MDKWRLACLDAIGITVYQARHKLEIVPSWDSLVQQAANCLGCSLCHTRTKVVFGAGDRKARLMIVGEAPGYHEDQQGEPFVGRAGKLLGAMLQSIGITRSAVYLANVIKCRPPGNRDPALAEIQACSSFLHAQLDLVQPQLVLALGRVAAQCLLRQNLTLQQARGSIHYILAHTPLLITYHPAYLLRHPIAKAAAYSDLLLLAQVYASINP